MAETIWQLELNIAYLEEKMEEVKESICELKTT